MDQKPASCIGQKGQSVLHSWHDLPSSGVHHLQERGNQPVNDSVTKPNAQPRSDLVQLARVLVLISGLAIALLGLFGGLAGLLVSVLDPSSEPLAMATVSVSLLVLATGLGLALAWQAGCSIQGRVSAPFRPRRVWLWIGFFVLAVALGQVTLLLEPVAAFLFPPFHLAAAILPVIVVLVAVGRSLDGAATWRQVVLQLSSGAFLVTFVAFALEMILIVGLLLVGLGVVALQPGGMEMIQAFAERLHDPTWLQDPTILASLATSPVLVLAALVVVAGLIPLIEETVKTIGVPLMSYQRPGLSRAFLWGLAGGAGFALAEGLFNTLSGLDVWAFVLSLRVGATLLHCFAGALMGMAWYYVLVERRWVRGLGLFAITVGAHGLWNALAAAVTILSLTTLDAGMATDLQGVAGLGIAVIVGLLVVMTLVVSLGLAWLTRWVRRNSRPPERESPDVTPCPAETLPAGTVTGSDQGLNS